MTDLRDPQNFRDHVRTRPGMYLGSNTARAVADLICGLIRETIQMTGGDGMLATVVLEKDKSVTLHFDKALPLEQIMNAEVWNSSEARLLHFAVLPHVCSHLSISASNLQVVWSDGIAGPATALPPAKTKPGTTVSFTPDTAVFKSIIVDYYYIDENLLLVAALNRDAAILLRDKREKYLRQNYLHLPEGIFYYFSRLTSEVLGGVYANIKFDDTICECSFQIATTWTNGWQPEPAITSFTNDKLTYDESPVATGAIDGIADAIRLYITAQPGSSYKFTRRKLLNGLLLMCAIRLLPQMLEEGIKEGTFQSPLVRKQVRKAIGATVLRHLHAHPADASKLLSRFDTTNPAHLMF